MKPNQLALRPDALALPGVFVSARRSLVSRLRTAPGVAVLALAVACSLLNTGCVTGRRVVSLAVPSIPSTGAAKGEVYLGAVTDNREFANKPKEPSTPSIDGDALALSAEQRGTFIGRQRNGYGAAMGDIALPAGDSVVQRTRLLLEVGLKRRGYTVTKDSKAADSIETGIEAFWAWFSPGMMSVSFESRIICTLTIKKAGVTTKVTVNGSGLNKGQMASDENWQQAYARGFTDFLLKLDQELAKAGF